VSRTERSGDLRERMQRVAAKPRPARRRSSPTPETPPPQPQARRATRTRPAAGGVAEEVAVRELPQSRSRQAVGRARSETALRWALWELTTVPARRWQWLKQFARGMSGDEAGPHYGGEGEPADVD
jgi:hypothetical protein